MTGKKDKTILVTGATGHQGRAVLDSLIKNGWSVRALTRKNSDDIIKSLEKRGAEVVIGDLFDKSSLDKSIKDVYGAFLVTTFMEKGTEGEIRQGKNLVDAAKDAGISHLIFTSVGAAERNTKIPHFESKREIEFYIRDSGLKYTIFRPVSYMYNFERPDSRESILNGVLKSYTHPDKKVQYIAPEDLGAFVNMAFDKPEDFNGLEIELAGDEFTMIEAARIFSKVTGRKVIYQEIPAEQIKSLSYEMFKMSEWLNNYGYKADIKSLHRMYKGLMTLESWLKKHGWQKSGIKKAA